MQCISVKVALVNTSKEHYNHSIEIDNDLGDKIDRVSNNVAFDLFNDGDGNAYSYLYF